MRLIEWVITLSLILIGLSCLTMSATWMATPNSIMGYANNFINICVWGAVPAIIVAVGYLIIRWKKGGRK